MKFFTQDDLYAMTRGSNRVVLVDLDGTLSDASFPERLGAPIPETVRAIQDRRRGGDTVVVWSGRFNAQYVTRGRTDSGQVARFIHWLHQYGIEVDGILMMEKPIYREYIDDNVTNVRDLCTQ